MKSIAHLNRLAFLLHARPPFFLFLGDALFLRQEFFAFRLAALIFVVQMVLTLAHGIVQPASLLWHIVDSCPLQMQLLLLDLEPGKNPVESNNSQC